MAIKNKHKVQVIGALAILLSVGLYFAGKQIPQEALQNLVVRAGVWGPLIFIILHLTSIIFAPISGVPFLITGFYLFGKTTIIYMYCSAVLGFMVNFAIARKWGRPLIGKLIGKEYIEKIDDLAQEYGTLTLIFLRLLWSGVADYVSYAYGLTEMKFSKYIFISAIASIPGWAFWYFVASRTDNIEQFLVFTYILTILGASIFLLGRRFFKKSKILKKIFPF